MLINIYAAWIAILLGCLAGILPGLFIHREDWLGGPASWPRRMLRLGHIAFLGLGFLNLAFALTCRTLGIDSGLAVPAALLIIGAITTPLVCYLSAWRKSFRFISFIPVGSVTFGVLAFLVILSRH